MAKDASNLTLSMALVEYFREQGRTLRDIGELVGLSESFISRVANGHRSFTIDHLEEFERRLGQPLAALLLDARWRSSIPAERREQFEEVLTMLRDLAGLRAGLGVDRDADEKQNGTGDRVRAARSLAARRAVG
jgi:transcriptional regulator with XRE-family HTH domain